VSELSIEAFFPADDATSEFVRSWAETAAPDRTNVPE
jgi:hypothetical protein